RDFAFAEHGMLQRLSLTVRTRSIIWGTCVVRVTTYGAVLVSHSRTADWTTNARNLSGSADGSHEVTALLITSHTHVLNSIANFKNLLFFHDAPLMWFHAPLRSLFQPSSTTRAKRTPPVRRAPKCRRRIGHACYRRTQAAKAFRYNTLYLLSRQSLNCPHR